VVDRKNTEQSSGLELWTKRKSGGTPSKKTFNHLIDQNRPVGGGGGEKSVGEKRPAGSKASEAQASLNGKKERGLFA